MSIINKLFQKYKKLHFSLIDPSNQSSKKVSQIAIACENYGTDAFLVGGSTVKKRKEVYDTITAIKKCTNLPVILFPNSAEAVSKNADGILFTHLMNSRNPDYVYKEQKKAEPLVEKWDLEKYITSYVVVSTSEKQTEVEKKAKLYEININNIDKAILFAQSGITKYNAELVYLEAGSGAEQPISDEMISTVKKKTKVPLIVGGGIYNAETARHKALAGADIIVTGTAIERNIRTLENIIKEIHNC